jgi:hypothetical protein
VQPVLDGRLDAVFCMAATSQDQTTSISSASWLSGGGQAGSDPVFRISAGWRCSFIALASLVAALRGFKGRLWASRDQEIVRNS